MKFIKLDSRGGNYLVVAENVAWLRNAENGQTSVGIIGSQPLLVVGSVEDVAAKILSGAGSEEVPASVPVPVAQVIVGPASETEAVIPALPPEPVTPTPEHVARGPVAEPIEATPAPPTEAVVTPATVDPAPAPEPVAEVVAPAREPLSPPILPEPAPEPALELTPAPAAVELVSTPLPVESARKAAEQAPARPTATPRPRAVSARAASLWERPAATGSAAGPKLKAGTQRMMGRYE